ncbi:hypothetical protein E1292_14030 [Nonomuraea deserti]|uniref:Transposase n=1 Tax=Nonomuraea deserti TaxID=1848322 RepID=A0A4R4VN79_9ACTN|nr:transposase [Nonomuraea deserti]TDD07152.1 hypothetical protein E1292_14030 [Nonomuraea deserti]
MPSPHPPEFRRRAVELARQGDKPLLQLAKNLGVSRSCLQNWLRQADADENAGTGDRLASAEKKELAELRRRNKQLEMENDILKRAAAYFARERPPKVMHSLVRELADDRIPVAVACECSKCRPRDITSGSAGQSHRVNSVIRNSPKGSGRYMPTRAAVTARRGCTPSSRSGWARRSTASA